MTSDYNFQKAREAWGMTDWESIAADQAMTIALLRTELEDARTEAVAMRATEQNLIAALEAEREACAELVEGFDACDSKHIAAAIRARSSHD